MGSVAVDRPDATGVGEEPIASLYNAQFVAFRIHEYVVGLGGVLANVDVLATKPKNGRDVGPLIFR